jgi:hypothetical protein
MGEMVDRAYAVHQDLLKQAETGSDPAGLVSQVEELIEQMRQSGAQVAAIEDRDYLQSLLTFWGNWVFKQTRMYPNTDLYPASPQARESAMFPVKPFQSFAVPTDVGPAPPPSPAPARGQSFIMANIVSPNDGARFKVGESVALRGMYANFQPGWRVFFAAILQSNRVMVLDGGFSVDSALPGGMWEATAKMTFAEAGQYRIGLLLAVTPEAAQTLQAAFDRRSPLDSLPAGVVPFMNLCIVSAQS